MSDGFLTINLTARSKFEAIRKRNKVREVSALLHPHLEVISPEWLSGLIGKIYSIDRITMGILRAYRESVIGCITGKSPLLAFLGRLDEKDCT